MKADQECSQRQSDSASALQSWCPRPAEVAESVLLARACTHTPLWGAEGCHRQAGTLGLLLFLTTQQLLTWKKSNPEDNFLFNSLFYPQLQDFDIFICDSLPGHFSPGCLKIALVTWGLQFQLVFLGCNYTLWFYSFQFESCYRIS